MRDAVQEFMTFNRSDAKRNAELMRFKIARMAESPFTFFRGSFHLFARDVLDPALMPLPTLANDGVEMELVGDIHSENYGTYKAADGLIHYDINDFDETTHGRFNFDVSRFAVNILLAAQERKDSLEAQVAAIQAGLTSYLQTLQSSFKKGKFGDLDFSEKHPGEVEAVAHLIKRQTTVKRSQFIADLTEEKAGKRKIKRSFLKYFSLSDAEKSQAARLLEDFRGRFAEAPENKNFFDIHDICGRISGIGSMGRHRYVVLVAGKGSEAMHNVLLEFKEARPSAYDIYRNRDTLPQDLLERAERVIGCQKLSQAACSAYLGHALDGAASFQVREISPHADRVDCKALRSADQFIEVMKLQAAILARTHIRAVIRSLGPSHPLPELADTDRFRQRVLAFALAYGDLVFRDWSHFTRVREELENVAQWAG